jgi:hypothetical protein
MAQPLTRPDGSWLPALDIEIAVGFVASLLRQGEHGLHVGVRLRDRDLVPIDGRYFAAVLLRAQLPVDILEIIEDLVQLGRPGTGSITSTVIGIAIRMRACFTVWRYPGRLAAIGRRPGW